MRKPSLNHGSARRDGLESEPDVIQTSRKASSPDFEVENHGSIFLLRALSVSADLWVKDHIPEDAQYFGNAVVVEARCFWPILEALQAEGYTVVPR